MKLLNWLQSWAPHHSVALEIKTYDNPGWGLVVTLSEQSVGELRLKEHGDSQSEHDWSYCKLEGDRFFGACGPHNFHLLLKNLQAWTDPQEVSETSVLEKPFRWLLDWHFTQCDGDWEHDECHRIILTDQGWSVRIRISETELEDRPFAGVEVQHSDLDWISCEVEGEYFTSSCSPLNLVPTLEVFQKWSQSEI